MKGGTFQVDFTKNSREVMLKRLDADQRNLTKTKKFAKDFAEKELIRIQKFKELER